MVLYSFCGLTEAMDKERTEYVFHKPRRPRERNVLWLPVDLAAHYGFYASAVVIAGGIVLAFVALSSNRRQDRAELTYAIAAVAIGVILSACVYRLQQQGRPGNSGDLIIRRVKRR